MNHDHVLVLCHNKWRTDSNTNSQVGVLFCRHNSNPVNLSYLTNVYQKHFNTLYLLEWSTTKMSFIEEKFEDSIQLVKQMNETRSLRSLDLKKGWKTQSCAISVILHHSSPWQLKPQTRQHWTLPLQLRPITPRPLPRALAFSPWSSGTATQSVCTRSREEALRRCPGAK